MCQWSASNGHADVHCRSASVVSTRIPHILSFYSYTVAALPAGVDQPAGGAGQVRARVPGASCGLAAPACTRQVADPAPRSTGGTRAPRARRIPLLKRLTSMRDVFRQGACPSRRSYEPVDSSTVGHRGLLAGRGRGAPLTACIRPTTMLVAYSSQHSLAIWTARSSMEAQVYRPTTHRGRSQRPQRPRNITALPSLATPCRRPPPQHSQLTATRPDSADARFAPVPGRPSSSRAQW